MPNTVQTQTQTQHNTTQHNTTQNNITQHNTTQHTTKQWQREYYAMLRYDTRFYALLPNVTSFHTNHGFG